MRRASGRLRSRSFSARHARRAPVASPAPAAGNVPVATKRPSPAENESSLTVAAPSSSRARNRPSRRNTPYCGASSFSASPSTVPVSRNARSVPCPARLIARWPSTIAVVPASACTARSDAASTRTETLSGAAPSNLPAIAGDEPTSTATSASASRARAVSVACTRSSTLSAATSKRERPSASSGASAGAMSPASRERVSVPFNRGAAANDQRPDRVRVERTRCA